LSAEGGGAGLAGSPRARFSLTSAPMWRIRLAREMPRYLLSAAATLGLLASARFALWPPRPEAPAIGSYAPPLADRAAEAYAVLFARRYLTWNAAQPQASARALEPFLGAGTEPGSGIVLPASGEQRVEWAEVVQAREASAGQHVYTVAAQTDTAGLLYMTVGVGRGGSGELEIDGAPAFVGPPAAGPSRAPRPSREVDEPTLGVVVARALRNYLAGAGGELAADLSPGARVSLPELPLTLDSVQRLEWAGRGSSVVALTQAHDGRGVHYALTYELDVVREQGRWEVAAVQTDPDS